MRLRFVSCLLAVLCSHSIACGDQAAEQLILATYKLASDASTATGLVVCRDTPEGKSRCFVVTANHALEQVKGQTIVLVARTRHDNGTFQRREIEVTIRRNGSRLWKKHAQHDLAVLPLPESVTVNGLPFDSLASEEVLAQVHAGDWLRLAVFPERSEANGAGFPVLRNGSLASYPFIPVEHHSTFLIDTTSWSGDSGGPVMHQTLRSPSGGPLVIGVVYGMRRITDTVKESRFVERKTHYPLGISDVIHATFARDLVEQCCVDGPE